MKINSSIRLWTLVQVLITGSQSMRPAMPTKGGCNPRWSTERCNKKLYEAASVGDIDYITDDLRSPINRDIRLNWRNKAQEGFTALHIASSLDQAPVVFALLEAGANPDMKDNFGTTALHLASNQTHTQIVRALLDAGANPNIRVKEGFTALHMAALEDRAQVARALLEAGANPDEIEGHRGMTPLALAAISKSTAVLRILLDPKFSADVNLSSDNNTGMTPVFAASLNNETTALQLLIDNGADVNKLSFYPLPFSIYKKESSPLIEATLRGYVEAVKILVDAGADLGYTSGGATALHYAALGNHTDIARLLLQSGADRNIKTKLRGETPAETATYYGNDALASLISNF